MKSSARLRPDLVVAANRMLALANAAEPLHEDPGTAAVRPGEIYLANASRFVETNFDEPLTSYAVGWRDPNNIDASVEFYAPATRVPQRFTYRTATNAEEFYSETEDRRAVGASFKRIEYTGNEVEARCYNRGLMLVVDTDEETDGWEQRAVGRLMRRLKRNSLRRAVALLSAAATNTAKTWDATAGKDPDNDVLVDLVAGATASGIRPNRVGYGDTAWSKRVLSHRAQDNAGGYASAALSAEAVAGFLAVDQVHISRERFQSTAAAKAEVVGNLVLMFSAMSGQDREDPSNIKRFVAPTQQGGLMAVYIWEIAPKLRGVAVEHYENIAITSTLGIRKLTIS